jgi:2-oxoglutarate ferredoxin oxidoreductase subunit alpha
MGHPTASPELHMAMTAKRRNKLRALAKELVKPEVYGPSAGEALVVGWGSSRGPIREAVDRAKAAGQKVASLHIRYLNPLPDGLGEVFQRYRHVFVAELNDEGIYGYGQLAAILRGRFCDPRIRGITKTDGLTFKVREILSALQERVMVAASKN